MKDTKNKNVKISEHLKLIVGKKEDSTYADITEIKQALESGRLAVENADTQFRINRKLI